MPPKNQFANEELEFEEVHDPQEDLDASGAIESAIRRAFLACDRDLSREIQVNLLNTSSNVLLHYYLSLAVSGSCATLVILYRNEAFIASTGDCRAVMGTLKQTEPQFTKGLLDKMLPIAARRKWERRLAGLL